MIRSDSYNTKQKQKILEIVKKQNKEFTVKDIYNVFDGEVGLTTIYRMIDKLVGEGFIKKAISNNTTTYQYLGKCNEENHFYLKCDSCGNLTHIDCDCISDLSNHILNHHKFKTNKENIIINGLCDKCIKKVE